MQAGNYLCYASVWAYPFSNVPHPKFGPNSITRQFSATRSTSHVGMLERVRGELHKKAVGISLELRYSTLHDSCYVECTVFDLAR